MKHPASGIDEGMTFRSKLAIATVACLLAACGGEGAPSVAHSGIVPPAPVLPEASAASATPPPSALQASPHALGAAAFRQLMDRMSEPNADFFSDNFISNETSYLQVASALQARTPKGGVYLGVGPEQNFSYIALTEPDQAYIVDIRRDNLVLHLLYKACFDLAVSRAHFLALLTARPFDTARPEPAGADLQAVMQRAAAEPASEASFASAHAQVLERLAGRYGLELDEADRRSLQRAHRALFEGGLDLRFELKEQSFRRYPSLRELLAARDPSDGVAKGFLAEEASFRRLQRMQRENRIIPLVGDFAGDRALPRLAEQLHAAGLKVRSFYVSNVEQYLLSDGKWRAWRRNVAALPIDDDSVFIRCYLDQGRPHPAQLEGHRTATTLQRVVDFNRHEAPYPSMLALASDRTL